MEINKLNGLVIDTANNVDTINDAICILVRVRNAMKNINTDAIESATTGEAITLEMIDSAICLFGGLRDAGSVWMA